jgi:hypothetical protein
MGAVPIPRCTQECTEREPIASRNPTNLNEKRLPLFIRYETTHERAFYRALKELQTLRKEKRNIEIGFESQKLKQAAEARASEAQTLRREQFEWKKMVAESKKEVHAAAKNGQGDQEMAA